MIIHPDEIFSKLIEPAYSSYKNLANSMPKPIMVFIKEDGRPISNRMSTNQTLFRATAMD
jgi:hypothetical protein